MPERAPDGPQNLFVLLSVLVDEAAHADIHDDAQSQKRKQNRGPAVAHERKRNPGDGHQPHHHADVDRYLKDKHGHHPHH